MNPEEGEGGNKRPVERTEKLSPEAKIPKTADVPEVVGTEAHAADTGATEEGDVVKRNLEKGLEAAQDKIHSLESKLEQALAALKTTTEQQVVAQQAAAQQAAQLAAAQEVVAKQAASQQAAAEQAANQGLKTPLAKLSANRPPSQNAAGSGDATLKQESPAMTTPSRDGIEVSGAQSEKSMIKRGVVARRIC